MEITNEQKYDEILKALGEAIAAKNDALYWANYNNEQYKEKLEAAEKALQAAEAEIEELKAKKDW